MDDHNDFDASLRHLARARGVAPVWSDHMGRERAVAADDLRRILAADGAACGNHAEVAESLQAARAEAAMRSLPPLIVAEVGEPLLVPADGIEPRHGRLHFEDGGSMDLRFNEHADGYVRAPAIGRIGYHRLEIGSHSVTVAVAPQRCFTAADATAGRPCFGLTAQIYGLRSPGDGGIGTFASVEDLCLRAGAHGADALALSPTHALFSADPGHFSPYSPSTRLFRNPQHADPCATFEPARIAAAVVQTGLAEEMARLETLDLVDWPNAARVRLSLLRALFESFEAIEAANGHELAADFDAYGAQMGLPLRDHAIFEALHARHFGASWDKWDWRSWSEGHADSGSDAVARFAQENAREVRFHAFLQWLTDRSQATAQRGARASGMRIGLICDLAVGMNAGGSHGWSRPHDLLVGLNIGAPPDPLAPRGQNWGLTTFSPRALRLSGYAPFIATLRAMFRHAGGLRIDHVMGLARLWLVPEGEDASHGAYVTYPFGDMLRLVRLESARHRAIVIGEDLGTVPHGFRERLEASGVYGMRVMQFERGEDAFSKPEWYAASAVAMTSTHDIPTVAGWWRGADLTLRDELDQFGPGQTLAGENDARGRDRTRMWRAFEEAGCGAGASEPAPDACATAADAAARFLALSASQLALAPIEDLLGLKEQPNLPGTTTEHPNWRRRYAADARRMLDTPQVAARLASLSGARPRSDRD